MFCSFQGKNGLCCYPSRSEGKAISKDAEPCYFTAQKKTWYFKRVCVRRFEQTLARGCACHVCGVEMFTLVVGMF